MKAWFFRLVVCVLMVSSTCFAGTRIIDSTYSHNLTPDFFHGKNFQIISSESDEQIKNIVLQKINSLGGIDGSGIVVQVDFKSYPKTNLELGKRVIYLDSAISRMNNVRDIEKEAMRFGYNPLANQQEIPINKLGEIMATPQKPTYEHTLIVKFKDGQYYYDGSAKVETPYLDNRIVIQLVKALMNNFPGSGGYNTLAQKN